MTSLLCLIRLMNGPCGLGKVGSSAVRARERGHAKEAWLGDADCVGQKMTHPLWRPGYGPVFASTAVNHDHQDPLPQLEFPHLPPEWRERYKKGQMYSFREQLMKLPVPSLQQTLDKYIASVEVCSLRMPLV